MSTLFRFEPIPGKLKSTHQTVFDASGEKQNEVTARVDQQGCLTDVVVTSLYLINNREIRSNTSLRRRSLSSSFRNTMATPTSKRRVRQVLSLTSPRTG